MAEIAPFKAWRYNPEVGHIQELISSLSNKSEKYNHPFNSIYLSFPQTAAEVNNRLAQWKTTHILNQDSTPSMYVYYQYYHTNKQEELKCLKGFICNIRIHDFNENIILRHEDTLSESMHNRLDALEKTKMNLCPTHGLYSDEEAILEPYLEECIKHPVYEFSDYRGVLNKVGIINDLHTIDVFIDHLKHKQIIIADGHHRYTASLEYQKKLIAQDTNLPKEHPANFHCMYLSNTEHNDINILPTFRLIKSIPNFTQTDFINALNIYFNLRNIDISENIFELLNENEIGVILNNTAIIASLKPNTASNWNMPDKLKHLSIAVADHFIIGKILNLSTKNQNNISFEVSIKGALEYTKKEKDQIAIITKAISINTLNDICYQGLRLPYKSTYFYPKVLRGLVYSPINYDKV